MRLTSFGSALLLAVPAAIVSLGLTGCAGLTAANPAPASQSLGMISGNVHGGQQPVSGATIQLYAAGTTGTYGTGSTALITSKTVTSDANGNFIITGDYTCPVNAMVYITASGGNPGLPGNANNAALTLMAGLGLCSNLTANTSISIDEVTTIASVYALQPFMTGLNVGAPPTNVSGLNSAFADIDTLVNTVTGATPGPAAPTGATVPAQEIYALANSLAACVNSSGGSSPACSALFTDTTQNNVAPADTVSAAINMARYPNSNAAAIAQIGSAGGAYPSSFNATTVRDLSLAVTYTGSGLSSPSGVAVDGNGDVWVTNVATNSVTELSHTGSPMPGVPYTSGISAPSAVAIDTANNAWIANAGNSSVTKLSPAGSPATYTGGGLSLPNSIAIDGLGDVWLSNATGSLSEFTASGAAASGTTGFAVGTAPVAVGINPH